MADLPDPNDRAAAVRGAREALVGPAAFDASILAAVQEGLLAVPAGAPGSWFDVPSQRSRRRPHELTSRRSH
jgi:hypothetical protein